ncbi:tetraspanin-5-like isoform X2 [Ptychodera flava]
MVALELLCLKYTFFIFNVLFWLIGSFVVAIGVWAHTFSTQGTIDLSQLEEGSLTSVIVFLFANYPLLIILVGGVMFCLATAGCIGALRENTCLLKTFSGVLVLIFLIKIALGLFLFITLQYHKDSFYRNVNGIINTAIKQYRDDINLQELVDGLQQELKCCGGDGFNDWENNIYFNCSMKAVRAVEACGVPFSCCQPDPAETVVNVQCGYGIREAGKEGDRSLTIYTRGCVEAFEVFLAENYYIIGGVPIGLALLE